MCKIRKLLSGVLLCVLGVAMLWGTTICAYANWPYTAEEVNDLFFSEDGKDDSSIAYSSEDSLRSYYYRSSYGKVDITGIR